MNDNLDAQFESLDDSVMDQLMGDAPATDATQPEAKRGPGRPPKDTVELDTTSNAADTGVSEQDLGDVEDALDDEQEEGDPIDDAAEDEAIEVDVKSILKAQYQGLVERGVWADIDGSEDIEFTEETYGEIAEWQARNKAEEIFNEMLDQSGPYGKAIMDHIKAGGNPDEVINIFKESKKVDSIDVSSEDGQQQIVRDYYKSVLGWSDARVTKHINRLVDSDKEALKEEAEEVKDLYEKELQDQLKETQREQAERARRQQAAVEEFNQTMAETIKKRSDIADKEQKQILADLLTFDKKLPDGRPTNQFTLDYMKLKADPTKYIDLVMFVRNPDKYLEKVSKKKETEVTKKTWEFIKNGNALKRTAGSHQTRKNENKSDLVIPKELFQSK